MDVMEAYAEIKQQREEMRNRVKAMGGDLLKTGARTIFDAHPDLQSFAWTQYTPYYNDGDPCVFRANVSDPDINGKELWDYEGAEHDRWSVVAKEIEGFLGQFDEEDMQAFFGDHCQVTMDRDGATVEEYEHD